MTSRIWPFHTAARAGHPAVRPRLAPAGERWLRRVIFPICLLAQCALVAAATPGEVAIGEQLRDLEMRGLSGANARLASFRGKPLLINVWASWCGPCRQEMASLDRLAQRYDGKAFNLIGISTDDERGAAADFLRRSGSRFRHYIDSGLQLENMLGADRLPMTLLVSAEGRVIKRIAGAREWDSPESINLIVHAFRLAQ